MSRTTTRTTRPASATARLRLGVTLMAASLAGSVFAFGPARAEEADPEPVDAEIAKDATYIYSTGHALPDTVVESFPPQVVCLVFPDPRLCGEETESLRDAINDPLQSNPPQSVIPEEPAPFAPPDTYVTGVWAGEGKYASAVQVKLPDVPEDQQMAQFDLVLHEVPNFTFHSDSPQFRQLVFAAVKQAGNREEGQFPNILIEELQELPDHDTFSNVHLGVEACPVIVEWDGGDSQAGDAKAPDRDSPERVEEDGEEKTLDPELNCAYGANGVRADDGSWTFDLTLAARAWTEGDIENRGVFLRPLAAANLAYGDPDPSTWDQVVFSGPEAESGVPQVAVALEEKPTLITFGGGSFPSFSSSGGTPATQVQGATAETFTESFGSIDDAQTPADSRPVVDPEPAPQQQVQIPAALTSDPVTEWWVWMFLPMLLGGGWLVSQALTAQPQVAVQRAGAMTRLIEARQAARAGR